MKRYLLWALAGITIVLTEYGIVAIQEFLFTLNGMEYFRSSAEERIASKETDIKLLTWNILGLPNSQVAIRPWEKRIEGIAEKIQSIDADVVILQECFEPKLSIGLRDRLEKSYAHIYLHLKETSTPLPSGLALFSKMPIADFRFIPHRDLLDMERFSKMGTIVFVLLNDSGLPVAHIAASHFQGSSNCEWRVGMTEEGERLSYADVRQQEAKAILAFSSTKDIPHYVCGDLNVDRRSPEYKASLLNEAVTSRLNDPMDDSMKLLGTNTNFWKHERGLAKLYPHLDPDQTVALALRYKKLYEEQLKSLLTKAPLNRNLSEFDPASFDLLEKKMNFSSPEDKMVWEYFKDASAKAVAKEKELWKNNQNQGEAPPVSAGRVIEIRALPIEESLDYVLGINSQARVKEIAILQGYDDASVQNTLSDHHPVVAIIRAAEAPD